METDGVSLLKVVLRKGEKRSETCNYSIISIYLYVIGFHNRSFNFSEVQMNDVILFAEKIIEFKSVYLAGGIQNRNNPESWREPLTKFFKSNNIEVYDPVKDNENIFNPSVLGLDVKTLSDLMGVDELKHAVLLKQTELNDMYVVKNKADLVVFYLDGTESFGTWTEFSWVYSLKKPFIIVRTEPRKKLPDWVKWRRYYALIIDRIALEFRSFEELKRFFIEYLGFKDV